MDPCAAKALFGHQRLFRALSFVRLLLLHPPRWNKRMPLTMLIEPSKDFVFIEATGNVILEEVLQIVNNLSMAGPEVKGRDLIFNSSRATGTTLNFDSIRRISDEVGRIEEMLRGARCAIIAPSDVMFGIARMFETLRIGSPCEVRSFREKADAESWLNIQLPGV